MLYILWKKQKINAELPYTLVNDGNFVLLTSLEYDRGLCIRISSSQRWLLYKYELNYTLVLY